MIPLHNLTNNEYTVEAGDGIIWVEFTKLTNNEFWETSEKSDIERPTDLKLFPNLKDLDDPTPYFIKAGVMSVGGVQSAFQGALEETRSAASAARESATNAVDETDRFRKLYTWAGVASAILIVLSVGTIIVQGYSLVNQIMATTTEIQRQLEGDRSMRSVNTDAVVDSITDLEERLENVSSDMNALRNQVDSMHEDEMQAPILPDNR